MHWFFPFMQGPALERSHLPLPRLLPQVLLLLGEDDKAPQEQAQVAPAGEEGGGHHCAQVRLVLAYVGGINFSR